MGFLRFERAFSLTGAIQRSTIAVFAARPCLFAACLFAACLFAVPCLRARSDRRAERAIGDGYRSRIHDLARACDPHLKNVCRSVRLGASDSSTLSIAIFGMIHVRVMKDASRRAATFYF
jgi:hypothetical protein